jgi:hypothetical protein
VKLFVGQYLVICGPLGASFISALTSFQNTAPQGPTERGRMYDPHSFVGAVVIASYVVFPDTNSELTRHLYDDRHSYKVHITDKITVAGKYIRCGGSVVEWQYAKAAAHALL